MTEYQGYLQSLLSRLQDLGINLPVSLDNMTLESIERCTDVIDQFMSLNKLLLIADSDLGLRVNETSGGVNLNDVLLNRILKEINGTCDLSSGRQTVLAPNNDVLESQHTNQLVKNNLISNSDNINSVMRNEEIDVDLDEEESEYDEYSQEDSSDEFDGYDSDEYDVSSADLDENADIVSESEYDTEVVETEEDIVDDEYDTNDADESEDADEYDTDQEGLEDETESEDYDISEEDSDEYDSGVIDEYSDDESEDYEYEPSTDDISEEDDLGLDEYNTPIDASEDELTDEYSDAYEQQVEDESSEFEDDYSNYNQMYDQYEDPESSLYNSSPLQSTNFGNNINNSLSGYNNAQQKGTNGDLDDILANKLKNVVDSVINKVKKPK